MAKKPVYSSKEDNFNRLAPSRVNALLNRIRILGNLSNRSSYEYTEEQVDKMFATIRERLKLVENKFLVVVKRKEEFQF